MAGNAVILHSIGIPRDERKDQASILMKALDLLQVTSCAVYPLETETAVLVGISWYRQTQE